MTSTDTASRRYTAFSGHRRIAAGDRATVAAALSAAVNAGAPRLVVFEDATGRQVDFDLGGSEADLAARLATPVSQAVEPRRPGRGRPKLGVVAREVTLLPRHWDWLASQPGGASAALRRLVDQARKANVAADDARRARDAAYQLMAALAGDLPGFEEAARALFGADLAGARRIVATWPPDVAAYMFLRLDQMSRLDEANSAPADDV